MFTDSQGRFKFTEYPNPGGGTGQPPLRLKAGWYSVAVIANQYSPLAKGATIFEVKKDENRDVGDVKVLSLPIRFSNKVPCSAVPAKGGTCDYTVTMTNGFATAFNGETWSIVNASGTGSLLNSTSFQTNSATRLTIEPGKSKTVKFSFPLSSTVNNNANICADVYVGSKPNTVWNTVGQTNVFCLTKSAIGFSLKPEKESFELSNKLNGKEAVVSQPANK